MEKLTDEKCKEQFEKWLKSTGQNPPYATKRGYWEIWKASRDALPILEQCDNSKQIEERICDFVCKNYSRYGGAFLCGKSAEITCYLLNMAGKVNDKLSCEIDGVGHILVKSGDFYIDPSIKQFGDYPELSKGSYPIPGVQFNANPKIDHDGWIKWGGGECPVDFECLVEVRFRDGFSSNYLAGRLNWKYLGDGRSIIAYRIIPEKQ